jgi:hypothetical protein
MLDLDRIRERMWKPCAADILALVLEVEALQHRVAVLEREVLKMKVKGPKT